jgi:hypothetical protein
MVNVTKYWCVNFDSEDCLRHGIEQNLWMMQYQYADDRNNRFQSHKPGAISNNWRQLENVRPGDWFVAYLKKNTFFAVGKVRKPRHDSYRPVNRILHRAVRFPGNGGHRFQESTRWHEVRGGGIGGRSGTGGG